MIGSTEVISRLSLIDTIRISLVLEIDSFHHQERESRFLREIETWGELQSVERGKEEGMSTMRIYQGGRGGLIGNEIGKNGRKEIGIEREM